MEVQQCITLIFDLMYDISSWFESHIFWYFFCVNTFFESNKCQLVQKSNKSLRKPHKQMSKWKMEICRMADITIFGRSSVKDMVLMQDWVQTCLFFLSNNIIWIFFLHLTKALKRKGRLYTRGLSFNSTYINRSPT